MLLDLRREVFAGSKLLKICMCMQFGHFTVGLALMHNGVRVMCMLLHPWHTTGTTLGPSHNSFHLHAQVQDKQLPAQHYKLPAGSGETGGCVHGAGA